MSALLIRQDLIPTLVGYVLIMGVLAVGLGLVAHSPPGSEAGATAASATAPASASARQPPAGAAIADRGEPEPGAGPHPRPGWGRLIIHVVATAVGGYLMLMAIVVLYYYGVARVGGQFIESAFSGCALLLALCLPLFLAASWLVEHRRPRAGPGKTGHRSSRPAGGTRGPFR